MCVWVVFVVVSVVSNTNFVTREMETLEKSRVCRLCGKHSGISIDIFDKNDNHFKKINAILPILVSVRQCVPSVLYTRAKKKEK